MEFDQSLLYASPDSTHCGAELRFTLATGRYAAQTFVAKLLICHSPTCDCASIGLECRPLAATSPDPGETSADAGVRWLDADLVTRKIGVRHDAPPGSEGLVQAVEAEIKDSDWKMLTDYFQNVKLAQLETMDIAKIDAYFPPEVTEEGLMCGYREVFPWSCQWTFPLDKDMWLMMDAYCVQPGCDCTDAGLSFFNLSAEQSTNKTHSKPTVFLYFDRVTGKTSMDESLPGSPPVACLMSALTETYPTIRQTLQQRHHQLQQLGRRLIGKRHRSKRRFPFLWGNSAGKAIPPQPTPAVRLPPPANRNDPCPCGSGRKFKKCCGAV